jgi:cell division protein FtsB
MAKKIKKAKVLLVGAVLLIIFLPSFVKYQALLHKNRTLEEKMRFLKGENKRLEREKVRLETDISYIERKAREEMGIVRKGEIVIQDAPGEE